MTNTRTKQEERTLYIILAAALAARLLLALVTEGYTYDMSCFVAWGDKLASEGPAAFYSADYFADYPPQATDVETSAEKEAAAKDTTLQQKQQALQTAKDAADSAAKTKESVLQCFEANEQAKRAFEQAVSVCARLAANFTAIPRQALSWAATKVTCPT